jgi:hypothetical protein
MRQVVVCATVLISLCSLVYADDKEKAEKQLRMMTAMSRDDTARSIISRTFADAFKMERPQMVVQRRNLGLNYGSLFLAQELMQSGAQMNQIVEQLRARKSMVDITNTLHGDWKRIAADAKKMNSRIDDAIYKHFLHSKPDETRDKVDRYNPRQDLVRADADATPQEIAAAQHDYVFWRDQAAPLAGGQADASTPIGREYEQNRDNIAISRGDTPTSGPGGLTH